MASPAGIAYSGVPWRRDFLATARRRDEKRINETTTSGFFSVAASRRREMNFCDLT